MNTKDTGGPAFSLEGFFGDDLAHTVNTGMTLRDYFAAKAMQTVPMQYANDKAECARVASHAYLMADAMLKARNA